MVKCVKLTDHQVCLSKRFKMLPPEKMENGIFFKFEILATNNRLVSNFEKHLSAITVTEQGP